MILSYQFINECTGKSPRRNSNYIYICTFLNDIHLGSLAIEWKNYPTQPFRGTLSNLRWIVKISWFKGLRHLCLQILKDTVVIMHSNRLSIKQLPQKSMQINWPP